MKRALIPVTVLLLLGMSPVADAAPVTSLSALQSAIDKARPGDRVVLAAGRYDAKQPIRITRKSGVTIAAASVGGAEIYGANGFTFDSSERVTVEGFRFTHTATVSVPSSSHHIRLSRNVFQLRSPEDKHWVNVDGDDVEVDRNTFTGKSTKGVYLSIFGPSSGMAQRTRVRLNYFHNHSFAGSNGGESIRLGVSSKQRFSARAVVENNLFEKANGDPEAISVKSSDNLVRNNTIRDSKGQIVLRHGNRTRVEGNIMLGGASGIRFYGNDHVIVNNVVNGSSGNGITVGSGTVIDDTSSTGNDRPDRVLVAFNTVSGTATAIAGENKTYGPDSCVISNNVLTGSGQLVRQTQFSKFRWEGNVLWGATAGNIPSGGYRQVDPKVSGELRRPAADSPC
ncbi:polysaccharide lyase 6 family protein [Allokutzneria sp. A3M-2-11 16]|uniref:polysaccharide lyase 6 family protein n=1 Tax=Allokutzneria sp. A3M-2-11 16 TaxID=2962043 RepID=UPI0020B76434|nr:polysaccharide lyase 6 family protein [Allokutzneria sp. A3M-2-11 16]MCP3800812.1 polysaccharide lyase 6 family protein [Allokutzneria sp. A3M-2-11 16]